LKPKTMSANAPLRVETEPPPIATGCCSGSGEAADRTQRHAQGLDFCAFGPYFIAMTKLLDQAVEAVRRLPADDQDDHIARAIIQLASAEMSAPSF
jgi:hypothetical protein